MASQIKEIQQVVSRYHQAIADRDVETALVASKLEIDSAAALNARWGWNLTLSKERKTMPVDRTKPFSPARWLLVAGLALLGLRAAPAQEALLSARDLAGGRLEIHKVPGVPSRNAAIWLPPGYEDSAQPYPVAYLLHGLGNSYERFTGTLDADAPGNVARLVEEGRIEPMILVMLNRQSEQLIDPEFWDFVATDLVAFADRNFRTVPERSRRAVGGHSLGGMDALTIALLRPEVFGYVGTIEGARGATAGIDLPEVVEALKLHKQFLFPLSFWIQRGTRGQLAIPRSVLDLFEALYLPYVYLETGDDHRGSLKTTKDFLVFFADQMKATAPGVPPRPGRVTEHFAVVAGSGSVLDIEVDLRGPSTDPEADLRVDLSALGLEPVLLDHDGSGRYTGSVRLPEAVHNGFYILPVTRLGERPAYVYGIRVSVLPSGDMQLFGEALSPAWQLAPNSQLMAAPEVFEGHAALALEGSGSWRLDWSAVNPPGLFGYEMLSFAFHAGTASVVEGRIPRLRLQMSPGKIIDLLPEIELSSRQWQRLVIPLERFERSGADERLDLTGFSFMGNLEGTFYLSDVRLMRREPPVSTAVVEEQSDPRPQTFALSQNFPNPFNSGTVIRFALPESGEVELAVFNLAGQQVAALVEGVREAGTYAINWDGLDDHGQALASGVYVYRLRAGGGEQVETRKLVLVR